MLEKKNTKAAREQAKKNEENSNLNTLFTKVNSDKGSYYYKDIKQARLKVKFKN